MQWALGSLSPDELQTIVRLLRTVVPNHELMSLVHVWLSVPADTAEAAPGEGPSPALPTKASPQHLNPHALRLCMSPRVHNHPVRPSVTRSAC
jgi:hypothetical protein